MKRIMLTNGDEVMCDHCHKRHVIKNMSGNNQGWNDSARWSGDGYDARGIINTLTVQAYCPDCKEKGSILRAAENAVDDGYFDTVEEALKSPVITGKEG